MNEEQKTHIKTVFEEVLAGLNQKVDALFVVMILSIVVGWFKH